MNGSISDPPGCAEVMDQLFAFVDGEMTQAEWQRVRAHLDECGPCDASYRTECLVKALVARSCCEHAPDQLRARVLVAIRRGLGGQTGNLPSGL